MDSKIWMSELIQKGRERDIAQTLEEREIGLNSEEGERVRCKTF